jgi:hypothetical protein
MDQDLAVAQCIPPTIRARLIHRRDQLARELQDVEIAIGLLDKNPSFEKIHDAISKVERIRGIL